MCSALVSANGLKSTRYIHVWRACFGSWIKEQDIFMCSALFSANGLKYEIYSCVARWFRLMD